MTRHPTCNLLVLNFNGRSLLEQCLPSVVEAAQRSKLCDAQTIVVDNQSQDGSQEWLESHFPQVVFLLSPGNFYLYALNWAAELVSADFLVMLNNDVILDPDSLDPLLEPLLVSDRVFSVTPLLLKPDKQGIDAGKRWGEFRRGFLHHDSVGDVKALVPTLFPTGGAFSIPRERFLEFGGFDRLYYPAYWEDVDLGYRAWKAGLINLFQPMSVMYHMKAASWSREDQDFVREIDIRNSWLFTWRNVDDPTILAANLYWTLRYYLGALKRKDKVRRTALKYAIQQWQKALKNRRTYNGNVHVSDREICRMANTNEVDLL